MIFRKNKDDGNYTQLDNDIPRNKGLSLRAKGLLWYMLSCKDDWYFSAQQLQKETNTKKDSVESALKELEKFGYLKRETKREKGRFQVKFYIYEQPKTFAQSLLEIDESELPF